MKPFKTAESSSLPFKVAPIRVPHYIQLDVYTDTRNLINIWLPESYGNPEDGRDVCVLRDIENRNFYNEGEKLVTTCERVGVFRIKGEVIPVEDGVELKLYITNTSNEILPPSKASVCIQFAAAPSFADSKLERYFYCVGDKVVYFVPPFEVWDHNQIWPYVTSDIAPHFTQNPPPDFPFMGLRSIDGEWVIGYGWDTSELIWGNCHPSMSCIHVDPMFGEINPGATAVSTGVLYIMQGKPEDCIERFRREFRENL